MTHVFPRCSATARLALSLAAALTASTGLAQGVDSREQISLQACEVYP